MSNIVINDIEMNQNLDTQTLAGITGGWIRATYSTADLHKSIYGDASPYGRNPVSPESSTTGYKNFSTFSAFRFG